MVRTGLLFPESSRPVFGDGGHERRGSDTSVSSFLSDASAAEGGASSASSLASSPADTSEKYSSMLSTYVSPSISKQSAEEEKKRKENPALLVLTHPEMEQWHKDIIREGVREYGIGVLFVPLFENEVDEEEELPVLQPLSRESTSQFQSFDQMRSAVRVGERLEYGYGKSGTLDEEMLLSINVHGTVEDITAEIVHGVTNIMSV